MAMSSLDVIVPCYRYGHFLRECVHSVLSQERVDVRVLIIDDASPDNSAEIGAALAAEDARISFVGHKKNRGHIRTYNEGIEWASSNYMLLLSADDYLLPGALERATAFLDQQLDVGFLFGRAIELYADGSRVTSEKIVRGELPYEVLTSRQFIELSGARNIVPTPTAIVRTDLQKRVGGYRHDLPHTGDMEMWLRLAAHAAVGVLDSALAVYRIHNDNMSRAYLQRNRFPDLLQRKAAFDSFFEAHSDKLDANSDLYQHVIRLLSTDAVSLASSAFNDGQMKLSDEFAKYALTLSPDVRYTLPWIKLTAKKALGLRGWRALQSRSKAISPRAKRAVQLDDEG